MSRAFQDENFLVWEVYPSASGFGYSKDPKVIFNCLTDPSRRPRYIIHTGDAADAERLIDGATPEQLLKLFDGSCETS